MPEPHRIADAALHLVCGRGLEIPYLDRPIATPSGDETGLRQLLRPPDDSVLIVSIPSGDETGLRRDPVSWQDLKLLFLSPPGMRPVSD